MKIVKRPGLSQFAGPTRRQLIVSRLLPVAVPLAFKGLDLAGLHSPPIYYFLTAFVLLLSARSFLEAGSGLGILVPLQLFAALLATGVFALFALSGDDWAKYSGMTLLMMGYVSFVFNLAGSYLPR